MSYHKECLQRNAKLPVTDDFRSRALRRIAVELIARSMPTPAQIDSDAILSISIARIARRARVSLLHATVVAELAGMGGAQ